MQASAPDTRWAPWRPPAVAGGAVAVALALTLLVPRLFSDPVGVDPFVVRLSAVAGALAVASLLSGRLEATRPVLIAVASMTVAFTVFAGGPQWIGNLSGARFGFNTQVLMASAAEAVVTVAFVVLAVRVSPPRLRPLLRLRRFGTPAAIATVAGVAIFSAVVMLLPATLLGRQGLAPIAVTRDLTLQGPASGLQSLAQELQFRGLLLGALDRVAPAWAANLGQATFFGLAHIAVQYQGPAGAFVPVTIVLGFVLGWVTQRSGSLWPAIVIHGVADIATIAVIPGLYGY